MSVGPRCSGGGRREPCGTTKRSTSAATATSPAAKSPRRHAGPAGVGVTRRTSAATPGSASNSMSPASRCRHRRHRDATCASAFSRTAGDAPSANSASATSSRHSGPASGMPVSDAAIRRASGSKRPSAGSVIGRCSRCAWSSSSHSDAGSSTVAYGPTGPNCSSEILAPNPARLEASPDCREGAVDPVVHRFRIGPSDDPGHVDGG